MDWRRKGVRVNRQIPGLKGNLNRAGWERNENVESGVMVGTSTVRNLGLWSSSEKSQSLLTEPASACGPSQGQGSSWKR